jgi:hypothetical protein
MLKAFEYFVFGLGGLFFLLTASLVYWNWNQELKEKLLSGVLLGTVTAFVLVYAGLKEERVEQSFRMTIAVDDRTHLPLFTVDQRSRISARQSEFASLSAPKLLEGDKEVALFEPPVDSAGTTRFCLDLLQYVIIKRILEAQKPRILLGGVRQGEAILEGGVHQPYRPTKTAVVDSTTFPTRFAANPFFTRPFERFLWEEQKFVLPRAIDIALDHEPASEGTGTERTIVTLRKAGFFRVMLTVRPLGSMAAVALADLQVPPDAKPHVSTHAFHVKLDAVFEKYRSRHWEMDEYKSWVDWTYEELRKELSD